MPLQHQHQRKNTLHWPKDKKGKDETNGSVMFQHFFPSSLGLEVFSNPENQHQEHTKTVNLQKSMAKINTWGCVHLRTDCELAVTFPQAHYEVWHMRDKGVFFFSFLIVLHFALWIWGFGFTLPLFQVVAEPIDLILPQSFDNPCSSLLWLFTCLLVCVTLDQFSAFPLFLYSFFPFAPSFLFSHPLSMILMLPLFYHLLFCSLYKWFIFCAFHCLHSSVSLSLFIFSFSAYLFSFTTHPFFPSVFFHFHIFPSPLILN